MWRALDILTTLIAWCNPRIPGFPLNRFEKEQVVFLVEGQEPRKCLLLYSYPKVAPVQVWGCYRAKDIGGTPGPSSKKTTCSFSCISIWGQSGNSGVVPSKQGRKDILVKLPGYPRNSGASKSSRTNRLCSSVGPTQNQRSLFVFLRKKGSEKGLLEGVLKRGSKKGVSRRCLERVTLLVGIEMSFFWYRKCLVSRAF